MNLENKGKTPTAGIDIERSLEILAAVNAGRVAAPYDEAFELPGIDGREIVDCQAPGPFEFDCRAATARLEALLPGAAASFEKRGPRLILGRDELERLGQSLFALLSYGVLNGGSATSYLDAKRNQAFDPDLYRLYRPKIEAFSRLAMGSPKGITPAYSNQDSSPGADFLELKLRALLADPSIQSGGPDRELLPFFPVFQMTSTATHEAVAEALESYAESPLIAPLVKRAGLERFGRDRLRVLSGVQPLLSALTPASAGSPRRLFDSAWGEPGRPLGLPGGHGQNFHVLRRVYRELLAMGKRFVYLGNIDNLGFTPDAASLALLALSGARAAFDFSFKTAADVKGGILVRDGRGRLTCVDIGLGVSADTVAEAEKAGKPVLFNAASGLFDLVYLVENLERIIDCLPLRLSEQDKDAGRYAQAEQVTWEVIGLLDRVLILGVDKYRRMLAAKLLAEGFMTCGLGIESPAFPERLREVAAGLYRGFRWNMENRYAMRECDGRWMPKDPENAAPGQPRGTGW